MDDTPMPSAPTPEYGLPSLGPRCDRDRPLPPADEQSPEHSGGPGNAE